MNYSIKIVLFKLFKTKPRLAANKAQFKNCRDN